MPLSPPHFSDNPGVDALEVGHPLSHLLQEEVACTFDDVLLVPGASDVLPHQADPSTRLGRHVSLRTPILSAAMDTVTEAPMAIAIAQAGGLGVIHKNMSGQRQAAEVARAKASLGTGAPLAVAMGVGAEGLERAKQCVDAGATVLVLDTAHGHARGVIEAIEAARAAFPAVLLIGGNVATGPGALALFEAGADVVKVGVGPGSICTTRVVAGVGVPQLFAIAWVASVVSARRQAGQQAALIADGGIKTSGGIVKALAAGADAVMLGGLLAGADEAPGEAFVHLGERRKGYRGMGSQKAMERGSAERYGHGSTVGGATKKLVAEGVEASVRASGPVKETVASLCGGVRAGMGYLGAQSLQELRARARYVRQSPAGLVETGVHDVGAAPPPSPVEAQP